MAALAAVASTTFLSGTSEAHRLTQKRAQRDGTEVANIKAKQLARANGAGWQAMSSKVYGQCKRTGVHVARCQIVYGAKNASGQITACTRKIGLEFSSHRARSLGYWEIGRRYCKSQGPKMTKLVAEKAARELAGSRANDLANTGEKKDTVYDFRTESCRLLDTASAECTIRYAVKDNIGQLIACTEDVKLTIDRSGKIASENTSTQKCGLSTDMVSPYLKNPWLLNPYTYNPYPFGYNEWIAPSPGFFIW
jgi:hypothetical protein